MDEETFNMSVRKFLKKLGVTAQREIELAVREQLEAGELRERRDAGRDGHGCGTRPHAGGRDDRNDLAVLSALGSAELASGVSLHLP